MTPPATPPPIDWNDELDLSSNDDDDNIPDDGQHPNANGSSANGSGAGRDKDDDDDDNRKKRNDSDDETDQQDDDEDDKDEEEDNEQIAAADDVPEEDKNRNMKDDKIIDMGDKQLQEECPQKDVEQSSANSIGAGVEKYDDFSNKRDVSMTRGDVDDDKEKEKEKEELNTTKNQAQTKVVGKENVDQRVTLFDENKTQSTLSAKVACTSMETASSGCSNNVSHVSSNEVDNCANTVASSSAPQIEHPHDGNCSMIHGPGTRAQMERKAKTATALSQRSNTPHTNSRKRYDGDDETAQLKLLVGECTLQERSISKALKQKSERFPMRSHASLLKKAYTLRLHGEISGYGSKEAATAIRKYRESQAAATKPVGRPSNINKGRKTTTNRLQPEQLKRIRVVAADCARRRLRLETIFADVMVDFPGLSIDEVVAQAKVELKSSDLLLFERAGCSQSRIRSITELRSRTTAKGKPMLLASRKNFDKKKELPGIRRLIAECMMTEEQNLKKKIQLCASEVSEHHWSEVLKKAYIMRLRDDLNMFSTEKCGGPAGAIGKIRKFREDTNKSEKKSSHPKEQ